MYIPFFFHHDSSSPFSAFIADTKFLFQKRKKPGNEMTHSLVFYEEAITMTDEREKISRRLGNIRRDQRTDSFIGIICSLLFDDYL